MENLRSRVSTPGQNRKSDGNGQVDPKEKEALNARLSDRRRQRREQRLRQRRNLNRTSGYNVKKLAYVGLLCLLLGLWVVGFVALTKKQTTSSPMQHLRQASQEVKAVESKQIAVLKPITVDESSVIDMRDMNHNLPFDNPPGGVWTQGWDVQPVDIDVHKPLKIFVVPHSHCDPGWVKTFDEYFQSEVKQILTTVVTFLEQNSKRKFIWAEISYFQWWWVEQTTATQDLVRRLLKDRQFEFVTGGWVQPDEANTQLYAMEIQLQEGHDFIRENFGEEYIPKFGWSIDPFGYSPTMAYLLKKYGFEAMLIQRVHYAVKKELALHKNLEFMWRQTWDTKGEYDIFTHVMPFYSYDVPHTCGPDPAVCCSFDFARMVGHAHNGEPCPWRQHPQQINDSNVAQQAMKLLDQYRKKANLYRSNVVIAPLGDDFRWRTPLEAAAQFENYERIIDYINNNVPGVDIAFGTLSEYFREAVGTFQPPVLKGSFFTYSDREEDYWSGYFTSRVFDKALDRKLERVLYAATSLGASKLDLQEPRRALSLFQHHDGVTGTAKKAVVTDYAKRIHTAIGQSQGWILKKLMERRTANGEKGKSLEPLRPCWQSDAPRGLSQNQCQDGDQVLMYNPLETEQSCGSVVVPGMASVKATLPCEVPGALPSSKANIQFDPKTGLMTYPIKEQWMVWKVKGGGAYLFFPGKLEDYNSRSEFEITMGGYIVRTKYWSRTVVERTYPTEFGETATVIDFVYETFLQNGNEEWLVRLHSDISNNGEFHTDLNGFDFDTHHFRSDMPIQSQVFPMPTHASIQDMRQRFTVLSEHAQGTASLEEGSIDVWLDRRLNQDDSRGLGEGVLDNVPTRTRLRVLIERAGYKNNGSEFVITELGKRMWKELNHPLEMFGDTDKAGVSWNEIGDESGKVSTSKRALESISHRIPAVFMVYKRVEYLKKAIDSIRQSDYPRETLPIVISHDGHVDEMMSYVESIKSEFNVIQLFHPYACSEHLSTFPGDDPKLNEDYPGDSYGNPRQSSVTCCKHHFTWMMNEVFKVEQLRNADGFLFLEEDYIVAPTVYETIQSGLDYLDQENRREQFFGIALDPTDAFAYSPASSMQPWLEKRFVTGPMVVRRDMFDKIKVHAKEYCTFDDYNWDWTIVHLMGIKALPHKILTPRDLQVVHIGSEGGLHESGMTQKKMDAMKRASSHLKEFHEKPGPISPFMANVKPHPKGYGGWGHPADHDHCLNIFGK